MLRGEISNTAGVRQDKGRMGCFKQSSPYKGGGWYYVLCSYKWKILHQDN